MQLSRCRCVPLWICVLLLPVSTATDPPLNCTELTQPLQQSQLNQILGTWILIEAYGNSDFLDVQLGSLSSEWLKINTTEESGIVRLVKGVRHKNQKEKNCGFFHDLEAPLVNSSALQIKADYFSILKFLPTCSECLLYQTYSSADGLEMILLYGKSQSLGTSELEMFRKQASCLHFPQPPVATFKYNPADDLCPMS
ncbi:hypothetical protein WMY93_009220 [Mugilogobius chulae]|uniref:Apolipoprotein M n=1 Tax=Mugilogobius chulae TaxID=88201 RepID=A0AAW0PJV4_9GOBI